MRHELYNVFTVRSDIVVLATLTGANWDLRLLEKQHSDKNSLASTMEAIFQNMS